MSYEMGEIGLIEDLKMWEFEDLKMKEVGRKIHLSSR